MDYYALLDLCTDLGYRLAMSGAETFRVEESINLIMQTYGIQAEAFAIPNNLTVSIETPEGKPMTRMRRIGLHGNDLDSVERYTNLSRRICSEKPDPKVAVQWMKETDDSLLHYSTLWLMIGNFLGAAGFSVFFGGGSLRGFLLSLLCLLHLLLACVGGDAVGVLCPALCADALLLSFQSFLCHMLFQTLCVLGIVDLAVLLCQVHIGFDER